jgi:hypothetical protein
MGKQKVIFIAAIFILLIGLTGCKVEREEQVGDSLDYTIIEQKDLPEILVMKIEEEKTESFKFSYSNGEYLYIAIGYGEQPYSDYSIQVEDVLKTSDNIIISTTLVGPSDDDVSVSKKSYPYIVVKTADLGMPVCFK